MSESETNAEGAGKRTRLILAALPLAIFLGLALIFWTQLNSGRDISEIPSALIGTKAPFRDLDPLAGATKDGAPVPALTAESARGKLTLVNFWASWCVPCRQEHPVILQLSKDPRLTVVGVNYKDGSENALRFLGELGNPFSAIGARISMSRWTSADFVTMPTGWLNLASTSRICRMIRSFFSIG